MQDAHGGGLAERRAAILSELALLFAQGRDAIELAEDAVRLAARATGSAAAFVYLWDQEEERLVLRVATPGPQQTGVGEVRLRLGEGIAGWVAMRQQSAIVDESPQDDPRFIGFAQIEEDEFHSMLGAPIADERNQLRGVFTLYSREERAFGDDELAIAVEVGRLLASGLVRAETTEDLSRQSASARFLVDFPTSATTSLVPSLQLAARKIVTLVDSDVAVLEYMSRRETAPAPVIFAFRSNSDEPRVWSTHSRSAVQQGIDKHCAGMVPNSVALGMGASRGVLTCYRRQRFRSRDLDRLGNLAAQLGVLLEAVDLNLAGSSLVTGLLFAQDEAHVLRSLQELGVDAPMCPVIIRVRDLRSEWEVASRSMKEVLAPVAGSRGVILVEAAWCVLLVDAPQGQMPANLHQHVARAMQRLADEFGVSGAVGIGTVTPGATRVRPSIRHARLALEWAELANGDGPISIAAFDEVRDVFPFHEVMGSLRPAVVVQVRELEPLVRYDIEQGSELVKTLSTLATCGGSVHETAGRLMIHRNTLRQRMQRIDLTLGLTLDSSTDWLVLALAARVAETRVARATTPASR